MGKFNGKGPRYCKNCGKRDMDHRYRDHACPNGKRDKTGLDPDAFGPATFDPQDKEFSVDEDSPTGKVNITMKNCRNIFDDYFLAILQLVILDEEIEEFADAESAIDTAMKLTKKAMKMRDEYLTRGTAK